MKKFPYLHSSPTGTCKPHTMDCGIQSRSMQLLHHGPRARVLPVLLLPHLIGCAENHRWGSHHPLCHSYPLFGSYVKAAASIQQIINRRAADVEASYKCASDELRMKDKPIIRKA